MKNLFVAIFVLLVSAASYAQEPAETTYVKVQCSWGELTMESIQEGFPQGPHVSDPSGDGKGPDDSDNPRVGLGNVVEQGKLQATCEFIKALL